MDQKAKDALILYCLGIGTDEAVASQIEQLSSSDWDEVIKESARHRIIPLLYQRIRTLRPRVAIPSNIEQELREIYLHASWKNTQRYYELSKVLRALQDSKIPVIALKGAALAEPIYQNIALRPMCDIDLLVKREDIQRIDEVLPNLGYEDVTLLSSKGNEDWIRHTNYTNGVIMIEFHPKIPETPGLNPWINTSPAKIGSADALILGAEDSLLHICLHLDYHLRTDPSALIWWCDIVKFLKHYQKDLDWDYVVQIAKKNLVEGAIHRILHTINEGFDGHIPTYVLDQLKDDGIVISISDILHSDEALNRELSPLLPVISTIPSIHSKLLYVFRRLFPRRKHMKYRYSVSRPNYVYFYYFISMSEVAGKALKILYRLPGHLKNKHISRSN